MPAIVLIYLEDITSEVEDYIWGNVTVGYTLAISRHGGVQVGLSACFSLENGHHPYEWLVETGGYNSYSTSLQP